MKKVLIGVAGLAAILMIGAQGLLSPQPVHAQTEDAAATTEQAAAPEPLTEEEMEVLVARIALYPDELVAAIVAASLYPVQIVQAQRYLDKVKAKPDLKPDPDWDGSVISLLNYPEIVTMMGDDLDWTEALGAAVASQQKEMLEAIQQLRDKAVAQGVLKSDEKTVVAQESGKVVIQPASANQIYVPVYEPEMLYEPDYVPVPVTYYPEPYPSYYYPTAPYFAGFVTGAIWGAAIDWNDWGVWGGNGIWGNDIDINCRNCFNDRDFNGNIKWNDVDWNNVDRNKISFDKNQFNKISHNDIRRGLEANDRNNLKAKTRDVKRSQPAFAQQGSRQAKDVRKSTLDGLQKQDRQAKAGAKDAKRPAQGAGNKAAQRPASGQADRPAAKKKPAAKKPAAKKDVRPKNPSPMGDINRGQKAKQYSNRGGNSMGGGINRGGGGAPKVYRRPGGGGGHGGGGRGGGRGGRR
jgi:hypothetical protein